MRANILIIGAGMATAYLLQELEQLDQSLDVTVIGDERDCCYNRVLLSNLLAGETTEQELQMLPADRAPFAKFIAGTKVVHVDTKNARVRCDHGPDQHYEQLVFATGSNVAKPALTEYDAEGIEVFRTLEDTRRLLATTDTSKKVTIVGGGLLGLEAAHGLNRLGHQTTVLHRNKWLMNRQLDEEGGKQLQRTLESQGIEVLLGDSISRVNSRESKVTGIELQSGNHIECETLLLATGIAPNKSLAEQAGMNTERGVLVDSRMRCSVPHTFAIGECSQLGNQCFGLVAPIRQQAKTLAGALTGKPRPPFEIEDWPTQLKISGVDIYRAGELDSHSEQLVLRDTTRGVYRRLVVKDEKLIGALLVGDKRGAAWYAELIRDGREITALRRGLMFGPEVAQALLPAAA